MTKETPEIVSLSEPEDIVKLKGIIDGLVRTYDVRRPVFDLLAKMRFDQYSSYLKAGFSEKQALELICAEISV